MLYPHKQKTVSECLSGRRVVFVGDSTVRQLYYGAVSTVDPNVDRAGEKHSNKGLTIEGARWDFVWDPFLNSTAFDQLLRGQYGKTGPPTLLVVGSGLWYLRHHQPVELWTERIDRLFSAVLGGADGKLSIADEVVLLPVEVPVEDRLSDDRKQTLTRPAVDAMNAELVARFEADPTIGLAFPSVFNQMETGGAGDLAQDGLHFGDEMVRTQARILLNLRCNDVLVKKFPLDKTCCYQYPTPNWVQILLLTVVVGFAPLAMHLGPGSSLSHWFPAADYLAPMAVFGLCVILIFFGDRTSLFLKEQKQYDAIQFGVLNFVALAAGLLTLKKPEKGDLGFLNRDQTDEWKGWMQIAILIYHYLGASKISGIYNPIRVCVAAYLFQSGYGHFFFFYQKADYGFARVFAVMVRLNLLTLVLAYAMDTDYLSYYFSPLVSMWFVIIWVTMWAGHRWNKRVLFVVPKLALSAALVAAFFLTERPLALAFSVINGVFGTEWFAREWAFRVTLDMYIVYWGMLAALVFIKVKEHKLTDDPRWPSVVKGSTWAAAAAMAWFFGYELTRPNKIAYNHTHAYLSIVPVAAFVVLRNATPALRSTSSKFFIYFGQCSLETFIIQVSPARSAVGVRS